MVERGHFEEKIAYRLIAPLHYAALYPSRTIEMYVSEADVTHGGERSQSGPSDRALFTADSGNDLR